MTKFNSLRLLCLILFITSCKPSTYNNEAIFIDEETIELSKALKISTIQPIQSIFKQPLKTMAWGNYYVHKTVNTRNEKPSIIITDNTHSVLREISPIQDDTPIIISEITDFTIVNNQLHILDFSTQSIFVLDNLNSLPIEKRIAYYLYRIETVEDKIIGYSNKKTQLINGQKLTDDFLVFDFNWNLETSFSSFNSEKFKDGTVLNMSPTLVKHNNVLFYTEFWSDTVQQINTKSVIGKQALTFKERGLDENTKNLAHSEIFQGLIKGKWFDQKKGVNMMALNEDYELYSYSNGPNMAYAVKKEGNSEIFTLEGIDLSNDNRFFKPTITLNNKFRSYINPYDLVELIDSNVELDEKNLSVANEITSKYNQDDILICIDFTFSF